MSATYDIPLDIWLYIAQFIPDDDLKDMYAVNRAFFDIALDLRYKEVKVSSSPASIDSVLRLQNPRLANRIKLVKISNAPDSTYPRIQQRTPTFVSQLVNNISTLSAAVGHSVFKPDPDRIQRAIELVVSTLPNVTSLIIEDWDSLRAAGDDDTDCPLDTRSIAQSTWAKLEPQIETLILTGMHDNLTSFLHRAVKPVSPPLKLKHVTIVFMHSPRFQDKDAISVIAPFLNSLAPQLRSLEMRSYIPLDLSAFFSAMVTFKTLEAFTLHAPFNLAFRSSLSGITRFMTIHSPQLRALRLQLSPSRSALNQETEQALCDWLTRSLFAPHMDFPLIHSLNIHPTNLAPGLRALVATVSNSEWLTSLAVRDAYLKLPDVRMVVDALPEDGMRIRRLKFDVMVLSISLLDLLATKAPLLEVLTLKISAVGCSENNEGGPEGDIDAFHEALETKKYHTWPLKTLAVNHRGSWLDQTTMELLSRSFGRKLNVTLW